ncbi:UPAR/Ly6 domain-containing protein CG9338-like [Periplaneta americana]|uniref:UPAR/Ly6 domain-containing protein CG9338-like n=1 Tax=Periplaneta americana TaxID=6978 RepID=UPI0037E746F9
MKSALFYITIAVLIQTGISLKCYICNSMSNQNCGDPIEKDKLKKEECTPNLLEEAKTGIQNLANQLGFGVPKVDMKFACSKLKIQGSSDDTLIMRSCTLAKTDSLDPCANTDLFKKLTNGDGEVKFCGTCEDDGCNGSSHLSLTAMLTLLVPCLLIFLQ